MLFKDLSITIACLFWLAKSIHCVLTWTVLFNPLTCCTSEWAFC